MQTVTPIVRTRALKTRDKAHVKGMNSRLSAAASISRSAAKA